MFSKAPSSPDRSCQEPISTTKRHQQFANVRNYLKKKFLNWLTLKTYYKAIKYLTLDLLIRLKTLVLIKPLKS